MKFNTPAPEDIVRWYRKGVPGGGQRDHIFDRLKAKITGKKAADGTHYFKMHDRQLSDKDADIIIANMKQDEDGYPMLETSSTSGEAERRYQEWIIERYLPVSKAASTEGFTDTSVPVDAPDEKKEEAVEEEAAAVVEEAEEEVKENIEEAAEVVDEALEDAPIEEVQVPQFEATKPEEPEQEEPEQEEPEQEEPPEEETQEETPDLSDIVDLLPPGMLAAVNQKTGQNYEKTPKKAKTSSGAVSNSKILSTLVTSLDAIAGTLSSIDGELKKQNVMLGEALGTTVSNLQEIETSHEGLNSKFDAILGAFQAQTAAAEEALDKAETERDIAAAQGQSDTAGTLGFSEIKEKKGGSSDGGGLSRYFGRIARWLWKKFAPKWLRSRLRLLRMKFGPENLKRRAGQFLNSQKERAGNFISKQKDRIGSFVGRQKDRIGSFVGRQKDKAGRFISGARDRIGDAINSTRTAVSNKVDDAIKYGDDAVKNARRFGGEAIEGVARFGQRFGDDAIRYGKRGLAFARNSPVAKRIAIASAKYGGRMVPVAGSAVSAADAADRAMRGDAVGAWLAGLGGTAGLVTVASSPAAVSGVGAAIPAVAEATSIAADTGLLVYDIFNAITGREFTAEDQKAVDNSLPQKETGGLTKPGPAILHGTEAIVNKDFSPLKMLSPIGGALIGASSNFLSQAGPAAALIAPMFKQVAGSLTNVFDVPTTLAQTNVGGSFAGIDNAIKDAKEKSEDDSEDDDDDYNPRSDYAGEIKDLKNQDKNSPLGMLGNFITNLFGGRNQTPYNGDPNFNMPTDYSNVEFGNTDELRFGLTGTTAMSAGGWSHAHFENQDKSQTALIKDTVPVVKKMASMGLKPETSDGRPFTTDMSDSQIAELIKHGSDRHTHSGSKPYAVDINMPGFPLVPVALEDVRNTPSRGEGINALIKGTKTAIFHLSYNSNGYAAGGRVGLEGQEQITVGEAGPEIVMKNLVASFQPVSDMLDAYNASTSTTELIQATRQYVPEILMYDEEEDDDEGSSPMIIIQSPPPPPMMMGGSSGGGGGGGRKTNTTKTLIMQKLLA